MTFPVPTNVEVILAEYLQRAFNDIESRMNRTHVTGTLPLEPYVGQIVYLTKAGQEGFYGYGMNNGALQWNKLDS